MTQNICKGDVRIESLSEVLKVARQKTFYKQEDFAMKATYPMSLLKSRGLVTQEENKNAIIKNTME